MALGDHQVWLHEMVPVTRTSLTTEAMGRSKAIEAPVVATHAPSIASLSR